MAENSIQLCCVFSVKHVCAKVPLKQFDEWWNQGEPECSLLNIQHFNILVINLDNAYGELSKAYDDLKATRNAEEIEKHTPEYKAFHERYQAIKAVQAEPEWNMEMARASVSQNEWEEAERKFCKLLRRNFGALLNSDK